MNIFVGCSSYDIEHYSEIAFELGQEIARRGHTLVFGASYIGLMKCLADGAIKNNGKIIGILPECYLNDAYTDCSQLIVTKTVTERKMKIIEHSDAFIFLPGGFGTVDEFCNVFEERRGGCINNPIIIINSGGHFNKFMEFLNGLVSDKFAKQSDVEIVSIVESVKEAMEYLEK